MFENPEKDSSLFFQFVWGQDLQSKWSNWSLHICLLLATKELRVGPFRIKWLCFIQVEQFKHHLNISLITKYLESETHFSISEAIDHQIDKLQFSIFLSKNEEALTCAAVSLFIPTPMTSFGWIYDVKWVSSQGFNFNDRPLLNYFPLVSSHSPWNTLEEQ